MARIIHDVNGGDQTGNLSGNPDGSAAEGQITILKADGHATLRLPEGDFLAQGDLLRDGQDLVLQSSDGHQVVVEGYFAALPAPTLTTAGGSMLTPELVQSFAQTQNQQYAAAETAHDASAIGLIKELSGEATITRADGTSEKAALGAEIHQGDIVETAANGAVNIVFLDESSFAISGNARMAIDEYVYDPTTQGGETNISILRGMFVFTSGLIGRDDPDDVHIETPVGSIGIRGTTIAGNIQPDGQSQITVVEGAIVIKNGQGEITLADQYQTVTLTGFDQPIQMVGTLEASQMKSSYGVIGTVAPAFMNTLNIDPEAQDKQAPADEASPAETLTAPAEGPSDAAPSAEPAPEQGQGQGQEQGQEQGLSEAAQPVIAAYDFYNDPLESGFEDGVAAIPPSPFDSTSVTSASLLGATGLSFMSGSTLVLAPVASPTETTAVPLSTASEPAPPLPPLEIKLEIRIDDNALAGDIVGKVFTTIAYENVDIKLVNVPLDNGMPVFELVKVAPGVYNVLLTVAGDNALSAMPSGTTSLGQVDAVATLPDGRSTTTTAPAQYGDFNGTPGMPVVTPLILGTLSGSDGERHLGSGSNGLGAHVAYLGDFNKDDKPDYALSYAASNMFTFGLTSYPASGTKPQIAGNGDLNGDGYLDFIVGSKNTAGSTGYVSLYNGASITAGTAQYGITAELRGASLAMVDFNGDGFSDVFFGAPGAVSGEGNISWVSGSNAFNFNGPNITIFTDPVMGGYTDMLGLSMTSLRDYNNDGLGDLAVGRMLSATTGQVTIYQGNTAGAATGGINIIINNIDSFNMPLFDLGDINGDGRSDLLIGQTGYNANSDALVEGRVLISMGGSNSVGHSISVADGTQIVGAGAAGDFNGDGRNDIFIATRTGNMVDAYVIYGANLPSNLLIDSPWLHSNHGVYLHMVMDLSNWGSPNDIVFNSTSVGDQNGDGYQDLLISTSEVNGGAGAYFVVYGRADPQGPAPTGSVGTTGADTLSNQATSFTSFYGGDGNDIIRLYAANSGTIDAINGGNGNDTLALADGNINLANISQLSHIEKFSFENASAQTLTLGLNDVFSLLQTSAQSMNAGYGNKFTVLFSDANNAGNNTLNIMSEGSPASLTGSGFTNAGTYTDGGGNVYGVYTHGTGYQLLIDSNITVTV